MSRTLPATLLAISLLALVIAIARVPAASARSTLDPAMREWLAASAPGAQSSVIIRFSEPAAPPAVSGATRAERRASLVQALQSRAAVAQARFRPLLDQLQAEGRVADVVFLWGINAVALTADAATISQIAQAAGVAQVSQSASFSAPPELTAPALDALGATDNLLAIHADYLWGLGYTGQGVVVAIMDSGVQADHPDLQAKYRGGANSWYDPYGQHAAPYDADGHGTQVAGIILGGDASGYRSIGAAPGATWIAARVFNDAGAATTAKIHLAFQWLLDPDGNPATNDAPDIVNNSWDLDIPGCSLEFAQDIQNLLAADILPIFAAGNSGPNPGTGLSPANNPGAFPVGAVDNSGSSLGLSARGPDSCGGNTATFPALVAPGSAIFTADVGSNYFSPSGTSFSAPHVAGGLALLLSAFPNTPVDMQRNVLVASASDLGAAGADTTFGAGMLNLQAAYTLLNSNSVPTSTPVTPTSTPTKTSTPTNTATPTRTTAPKPTSTPTATTPPAQTPPQDHVFLPLASR